MAKIESPASEAMDADFLKRTVGNPLSEALTSLVMAQPADPIEFIGEALLAFVKRREEEERVRSLEKRRERQRLVPNFVLYPPWRENCTPWLLVL